VTANGGGAGGSGGGLYAEPIRVGDIGSTAQAHRVYSCDGKSVTINAGGGGQGGKTGLYLVPYDVEELSEEYYHGDDDGNVLGKIVCKNTSNNNGQPAQGTRIYKTDNKSICLDADSRKYVIDTAPKTGWCIGNNGKKVPVYEVKEGLITIKGKQYPIKLADGYYIIRKLTVRECMRLQTVPEWYDFGVISNAQAYKCLGNGWTCDVITHLINATQTAARRKWLNDLLGDCL
jgi:DNA (cytosine-5)-methyltransferase 3A